MEPVKVTFEYDPVVQKWDVFVSGVSDDLEARQAFNAVLITSRDAIPMVDCNRAEHLNDGRFKIWVGVNN